jgi:hypothetical protein
VPEKVEKHLKTSVRFACIVVSLRDTAPAVSAGETQRAHRPDTPWNCP